MKTNERLKPTRLRGKPWPLLCWAVVLSASFAIAHLLGLRQYTSVLSGTASFAPVWQVAGLVYIGLYVLFVVGVPILLLAASLQKAVDTASAWRAGKAGDAPAPPAVPAVAHAEPAEPAEPAAPAEPQAPPHK